jgi:lipoprotein-anchoring transpeptidase ErfK/SrfK
MKQTLHAAPNGQRPLGLPAILERIISMNRNDRHVCSRPSKEANVAKKPWPALLPRRLVSIASQALANAGLIENKPYSKMGSQPSSFHNPSQENQMRLRNAITAFGLLLTVGLASCSTTSSSDSPETAKVETSQIFSDSYGKVTDSGYALPAIPIDRVDKKFHRQIVSYQTNERRGTIIVDTRSRFLYYILGSGKAVRYGIGVGKQGFSWKGEAYVAWKQEWPTWHPPAEMAERKPEVAKYVEKGQEPGIRNPLGARAMYLFDDKGRDTMFRLHGTPEWSSIGTAASSGCIRLMNQDVIDLYSRVRPGKSARVIVL